MCDQAGDPSPRAGGAQRTQPQRRHPLGWGRLPGLPKRSAAQRAGLLLAAGGRRQRLRFAGSGSVAPRSACPQLTFLAPWSARDKGTLQTASREWMQAGGGERARRQEGRGKSRAGSREPGWPSPREDSERAAGAGGGGGLRGGGGGGGGACSRVAARGAARRWRAAPGNAGLGAGLLNPLGSTTTAAAGHELGGGASAPRTRCPPQGTPYCKQQTQVPLLPWPNTPPRPGRSCHPGCFPKTPAAIYASRVSLPDNPIAPHRRRWSRVRLCPAVVFVELDFSPLHSAPSPPSPFPRLASTPSISSSSPPISTLLPLPRPLR